MAPYSRIKTFSEYILEAFNALCLQNDLCVPNNVQLEEEEEEKVYGDKLGARWTSGTWACIEKLDIHIQITTSIYVSHLTIVKFVITLSPEECLEKKIILSDEVCIDENLDGIKTAQLFTQNNQIALDKLIETIQAVIPYFIKILLE